MVVDCNDFERMVAFWREALHYVPREPSEGGWVVLRDPDGNDVNVSFQQVVDRIASRSSRCPSKEAESCTRRTRTPSWPPTTPGSESLDAGGSVAA